MTDKQRVIMAGQAGDNPNSRYEGHIIAGPFEMPEPSPIAGECYVVVWDKWTDEHNEEVKEQNALGYHFADIRSRAGLVFMNTAN